MINNTGNVEVKLSVISNLEMLQLYTVSLWNKQSAEQGLMTESRELLRAQAGLRFLGSLTLT